jgi:serpin B
MTIVKRRNITLTILLLILAALVAAFILLFLQYRQSKEISEPNENPENTQVQLEGNFDIDIFKQCYTTSEEGKNVVVSPLSIKMAMSMASEGASGETLEQIQTVLGIDDNSKNTFKNIIENSVETDDINIDIANSLWINDNFNFRNEYLNTVENYYKAQAKSLDFSSSNAKTVINNCVKEQTRDKIPTIIDEVTQQNIAFLINAIYFNARWNEPFEEDLTSQEEFNVTDELITVVDLMYLDSDLNYLKNDDVQAVKLPYGEDENYTMTIYLPDEDSDISTFVNNLTNDKLKEWDEDFQYKEGLLRLPRFRTEFSRNLSEDLNSLGIRKAFQSDADFTNMIEGEGFYISKVQHKTYIDVTEQGTEAAAATAISMEITSMPNEPEERFEMIVNRPFFFTISDNRYNAVLFMGVILDPTQ